MATRKKAQSPTGLKESAYEIWLAGLGAFNIAGEEGGRIFKQLVKKGREQEEAGGEWLAEMKERAQALGGDARQALKKAASPIEDGLATAMQKLGVPTRKEIVTLTHRVEELTKHVTKAKAAAAAPKPKPRPKKVAAPAKPKPRPRPKAAAPKRKTAEPAGNVTA